MEQYLRKKLFDKPYDKEIPDLETKSPYLGYLNSISLIENDYDIYGYITTTRVKIAVIMKQKKSQGNRIYIFLLMDNTEKTNI